MNNYVRSRLIGCGVVIAVLIVIGIGVAIYQGVVAAQHAAYAGPFKAQMTAYLAPPHDAGAPDPEGAKAGGPVKGKMVVLDVKAHDFDWDVTGALPDGLKAVKPEEVGTVVQLAWDKEPDEEHDYGPGHPAYWQACDVTVIDSATQSVIAKDHFRGGPPPDKIDENASEGVGPKPTAEVVSYLKGLPHQ